MQRWVARAARFEARSSGRSFARSARQSTRCAVCVVCCPPPWQRARRRALARQTQFGAQGFPDAAALGAFGGAHAAREEKRTRTVAALLTRSLSAAARTTTAGRLVDESLHRVVVVCTESPLLLTHGVLLRRIRWVQVMRPSRSRAWRADGGQAAAE